MLADNQQDTTNKELHPQASCKSHSPFALGSQSFTQSAGWPVLLLLQQFLICVGLFLLVRVERSMVGSPEEEERRSQKISINLSIYLPIYPPIYLPTYLPTYLPIYLSIDPSIHLSIYPRFTNNLVLAPDIT